LKETKIIHIISSLARGGRERQLATIYKNANKQLYPTKIVVFNKSKDDYIEEYKMRDEDLIFLKTKKPHHRLNELVAIFKEYRPDIIYAWGGFEANFCFILSPFTKAKIVNGSVRHGIVIFNRKHLSRFFVLHLSKYIIANSKAGLRANKLNRGYVLYNGIEKKFTQQLSAKYKIQLLKSVFGNYKGEPVIISVANLVSFKDYFTVFKSLRNIKDRGFSFRYLVIGEGSMREQLEKEIKNLELIKEVRLFGRTDKVEQYLQAADLFVHSSKGEGCSNAILEAMSAGLPIIATNTGGTPEITCNENGQLFEYQNKHQLTNALEAHLNDPEMRVQKGKQSKRIIEKRFTVEKMIINYLSILKKIVN